MVCRRFARSLSLRRERVKQEASVNAAPNPRMVCAGFAGSTVTSAGAAFFAIFAQAISAPAASRFPLLSVTSVCAGWLGGGAWFAAPLASSGSPNAEAVAAPTPSPAYFKISRRDVTLGSRLSLNCSRRRQPTICCAGQHTAKLIILGTAQIIGLATQRRRQPTVVWMASRPGRRLVLQLSAGEELFPCGCGRLW